MQQRGPWQIVQSHEVYRDPWVSVRKDDVIRPDGQPGTHSVVTIKSGVCVLAMDDDSHVYLTEEFHYAVGRTTVEAVSGGMEANEEALATAKRELEQMYQNVKASCGERREQAPTASGVGMVNRGKLRLGIQAVDGLVDREGVRFPSHTGHPVAAPLSRSRHSLARA